MPPTKWYAKQPVKHQRYPGGQLEELGQVTIALGMLASDALVVGADTEVGVDDSTALKNHQGKITWASHVKPDIGRIAGLAVTGSGTLTHLKHLQQDLSKLVTGPHRQRWGDFEPPLMRDFESAAIEHIKRFHCIYVAPFAGYATAPHFNLLFAYYSPDGDAKLWSTNENLIVESQTFATVGIGAMYANILLHRLFLPMWPMNHRVAILLAAYVLREVKDNIAGCGKDSDIACFGANFNRGVFVRREQIKELEILFDELTAVQTEGTKIIFMGDADSRGRTSRKFNSIRRKIDRIVTSVERLI